MSQTRLRTAPRLGSDLPPRAAGYAPPSARLQRVGQAGGFDFLIAHAPNGERSGVLRFRPRRAATPAPTPRPASAGERASPEWELLLTQAFCD